MNGYGGAPGVPDEHQLPAPTLVEAGPGQEAMRRRWTPLWKAVSTEFCRWPGSSTGWGLYAQVVSAGGVPRERSSERPTLCQTDLRAAYKSRPLGRLGPEAANFLRNCWLRSLLASLLFRSRLKRALSPLIADMVT